MTKVLFLGCNTNQVPYLRAAKNLGFTVVGTDLNPRAPGATIADKFYPVGYADADELMEVAEKEGFGPQDKIFTAAAHFAWEGASGVAAQSGIPYLSPETTDICLDKTKLYPLMQDMGVPVPPAITLTPEQTPSLDADKVYYLKSDYGKTPNYCYRITGGEMPLRPAKYDRFYRRAFLLQEEVRGSQYRVNLFNGKAAVFLKLTDTCNVPLPVLGPGHGEVVNRLSEFNKALGLENLLTKFDLIINADGWHVIDLGLDPPMRMRLLYAYLGLDFPMAYTRYYLTGDPSGLLPWQSLASPLVMKGTLDDVQYILPGEIK